MPSLIVPYIVPISPQEFDQAMPLIMQGECGKVVLLPEPKQ
jgi:hypothetical protein